MFGVWEPLLEPLEIENSDEFRPWVLELKVWFRIIISLVYRDRYVNKYSKSSS